MDIFKYGGNCQVIAPDELRDKVMAELGRGLGVYT